MSSTWPECWYEFGLREVLGIGATWAADDSERSVAGPDEVGRSEGIDSDGFTAAVEVALLLLFVMSCYSENDVVGEVRAVKLFFDRSGNLVRGGAEMGRWTMWCVQLSCEGACVLVFIARANVAVCETKKRSSVKRT